MKKSTLITLVILTVILIVVAWYTVSVTQKMQTEDNVKQAAEIFPQSDETPYTDINGNLFTFEQFDGKVRVVTLWATWCPFCSDELLDFQKLAQKHSDDDVVVVAVNRKESSVKASQFIKTLGGLSNLFLVIDPTDNYYQSVGGFSMPETVFYDKQGNVVFHKRGSMTFDEMEKYTQDVLNKSSINNTN